MKVYRIEHKSNGKGPYRGLTDDFVPKPLFSQLDKLNTEHSTDTYHIGIRQELLNLYGDQHWTIYIEITETHVCGFKSKVDLYKWFKGYLEALYKENFIIAEYETDDVIILPSNRQLLFVKPNTN